MKKIIAALGLTIILSPAFAETCPTIHDIKNQAINGWSFVDAERDVPLSAERITEFKERVTHFGLAESINVNGKPMMHCYYLDKGGSNLEAFLSKENEAPINKKKFWYQVTGATHCAASLNECTFNPTSQLAENN
jgi:hypothetical protein